MKLKLGDKVTVAHDIYLGLWLKSGDEGVITACPSPPLREYYTVKIKGHEYTMAEAEVAKFPHNPEV